MWSSLSVLFVFRSSLIYFFSFWRNLICTIFFSEYFTSVYHLLCTLFCSRLVVFDLVDFFFIVLIRLLESKMFIFVLFFIQFSLIYYARATLFMIHYILIGDSLLQYSISWISLIWFLIYKLKLWNLWFFVESTPMFHPCWNMLYFVLAAPILKMLVLLNLISFVSSIII